jgi:hypothetical protein
MERVLNGIACGRQLSITHSEQWCYEFFWEGWVRN